jgi:hypothetical protein
MNLKKMVSEEFMAIPFNLNRMTGAKLLKLDQWLGNCRKKQ